MIHVNVPLQISSVIFVNNESTLYKYTQSTKVYIYSAMKELCSESSRVNKKLTKINSIYKSSSATNRIDAVDFFTDRLIEKAGWRTFSTFFKTAHFFKLIFVNFGNVSHICCIKGQGFMKASWETTVHSFPVFIQNSHELVLKIPVALMSE